MSLFGPSDQQIASEEQAKQQAAIDSLFFDQLPKMSRDELIAALEMEHMRNEKLSQEVKELREEKVRLSLILEEEDERRANLFLRKVEELEAASLCARCNLTPAAVLLKTSPSNSHLLIKSNSMAALPEQFDE